MSRGNVFERHHLRGTKSGEVNKAITASGENADKPKMHQGTSDFFSRTKPARRRAGTDEPDVLDMIAALEEDDIREFLDAKPAGVDPPEDDPHGWSSDQIRAFLEQATK